MQMSCKLIDSGGYNSSSRWEITLTEGGASHTFLFTQGSAYRKWKIAKWQANWILSSTVINNGIYSLLDKCGRFAEGEQVPVFYKNIQNQEIVDFLNSITEPTEPQLDNVLYCLCSDAICVNQGQTFESFCEDAGYDTDSIKAKKAYDDCTDNWRGLIRLGIIPEETLEKLDH